jgi:methyl-accepting chemotaxis protein
MPPYILFISVILGYFFYSDYQTSIDQHKLQVTSKIKYFNNLIEDSQQKAFQIAELISHLPFVEKAFTDPNVDNGRSYLQSQIMPIIKDISKDVKDFQVHFHKPGAISFLRTWTNKNGDDLSKFRNTIVSVNETKKPVVGIEVGVGGFAIRGVVPIFSATKSFIGSVEFFYNPETLLNIFKINDKNFGYIAGVSKSMIDGLVSQSEISKSFPNIFGSYYVTKINNDKFNLNELFNDEVISSISSLSDIKTFNKHTTVYGINPIKDFQGKNAGFISLIETEEDLIEHLIVDTVYILIVMIFASIFLLLVYNSALNKFVIRPIDKANEIAKKIAHGDIDFDL